MNSRILFVPRGSADFERFVALIPHLKEHEILIADFSARLQNLSRLHMRLMQSEGRQVHDWRQLGNFDSRELRAASKSEIELAIRRWNPDVLIIDQFGPTCAAYIGECRDIALALGIRVCMIPHGVRTVDLKAPPPSRRAGPAPATVVFYTSEHHRSQADWYFGTAGSFDIVLGDPRFDHSHLCRLLTFADPAEISHSHSEVVHITLYGSNFEKELLEALRLRTNDQPDMWFLDWIVARTRWDCSVRFKSHPRSPIISQAEVFSATNHHEDGTILAAWSDVVATVASSSVIEGLVLGRPAIVLDIPQFAPNYSSIFCDDAAHASVVDEGSALIRIEPNSWDFLQKYCWAGLGPNNVARSFAHQIELICQGDLSGLRRN